MKSVIIDRLIEIEDGVLVITDEIREKEGNLPVIIQQRCNEIEQKLKEEYEEKVSALKAQKEKETAEKIEELEKDSQERHKKISENYNDFHKIWEDEILAKIKSIDIR